MDHRDVIWITLESVRQDFTSIAGGDRETTPNLKRIATEGAAFTDCYAHGIWTRSSSASILTGQAPSAHQAWSNDAKLSDEIQTIPEAFRDSGYKTAGVSPIAQVSSATGLDRGFENFHYLGRSSLLSESGPLACLRWLANLRHHSGGLTLNPNEHCLGYFTNYIAKDYINEAANQSQPLFLYLHHGDSHHPYVPPLPFRQKFDSDLSDEAIELALEMSERLHELIALKDPFTDEEWQTLRTLYQESISYVDHLVGQLINYARQQLQDPIIIVTADHGELFGEQGLLAHMLVANTAVSNVPLVVNGIEGLPSDGLIQPADIMKILCEDLNIDHKVPIGQDIRKSPREFAVTQRGGTRAQAKLKAIQSYCDDYPTDRFHSGDLTSVRTKKWRYQTSDMRSELFELPDEDRDVSDVYPETAEELDQVCEEWLDEYGGPVGEAEAAQLTDEMESQLTDLGYL